MKTVVIIMLLASFSVVGFAQHDFSIKPLPKIEFDDFNKDHDPACFAISPPFKPDTFKVFPEKKWNDFYKNEQLSGPQDFKINIDNMPIAKLGENNWNMPIAVPDPTVHYHLRIAGGRSQFILKNRSEKIERLPHK